MASNSSTGHDSASKRTTFPPPQDTFMTLWAEALRKFQQGAHVQSARWESLLQRMSDCDDEDDICAVLDEIMQGLEHFRVGDSKWSKIKNKYLKPALRVLLLFNDAIAEIAANFPGVPGGKAIFVAFGVLLEATKGVDARCEALIGLLEELKIFLESLRIRLTVKSDLGQASKTISIMILGHLLEVFLNAMNLFSPSKWRMRRVFYRDALIQDETVKKSLERLRDLRQLETQALAAETSVAVSQLAKHIQPQIDSLQKRLDEISHTEHIHHVENEIYKLLEKIGRVGPADIDAQNSNGCLAGTRRDILADLIGWSHDPNAPRIYWLNGMAGTGKSAIARSFCQSLRNANLLGGSFFCSRTGSADQTDAQRIIPTLSVCMALRDSHCTMALLAEIDAHNYSPYWNFEIQIERLLVKPFAGITSDDVTVPVLVIDALDECSKEDATGYFLRALVKLATYPPVKVFLTSRPEPQIRQHLENMNSALGRVLRLHDVERDLVETDISLYLTHGLRSMRTPLPDWPEKKDVVALTRLSGKLFIYAFTALQYVHKSPVERLSKLIGTGIPNSRAMNKRMDDIYNLILSEALNPDEYDDEDIDVTLRVIAAIVFSYGPLTIAGLAQLLDMSTHGLRSSLDRLYAVIYVPIADNVGFLSTFHASFGDYLTTYGRAPERVRSCMNRINLFTECMTVFRDQLRFNISGASTSYLPNRELELDTISETLRYVCLHWPHHVIDVVHESTRVIELVGEVFVGPRFLHWLEALSIMGLSREAVNLLSLLSKCFESQSLHSPVSQRLSNFIRDAIQFCNDFSIPIAESTPHIYLSALALSPVSSSVRSSCLAHFPRHARLYKKSPCFPSEKYIFLTSAAFVARGCDEQIVVAFSSGELHRWNLKSGKPLKPLVGRYPQPITAMCASSSDECVCFGNVNGDLCMWDLKLNTVTCAKVELKSIVKSLAFSPDSHHIASGSLDGQIYIWNVDGGIELSSSLTGQGSPICILTFSPDGSSLISGSLDCKVCLWDMRSKVLVQVVPFPQIFGESVRSLAFSPDGNRILAGFSDGTVHSFCPKGPQSVVKYNPLHSHLPSFVFADARRLIASPTDMIAACVWATEKERTTHLLLRNDHIEYRVQFATISPHGSNRILLGVQTPPWSRDEGTHIRLFQANPSLDNDSRPLYTFGSNEDHALRNYPCRHSHVFSNTPTSFSPIPPMFRLSRNGWIKDVSCDPPRLLIWIPPTKRKGLPIPPECFAITSDATYSLDLSRFSHGARWTECYQEVDAPESRE